MDEFLQRPQVREFLDHGLEPVWPVCVECDKPIEPKDGTCSEGCIHNGKHFPQP